MNLADLFRMVPEAFHDSALYRIEQDFETRTVRLLVNFSWCGPEGQPKRTEHKRAWVTLTGVQRWLWDFDSENKISWGKPLRLEGDEADAKILSEHKRAYEGLDADLIRGWFFVHDWNALILWAARDIELRFLDL